MSVVDFIHELEQKRVQLNVKNDQLSIKAPPGAITPELKAQLKEYKAQLIDVLKQVEIQNRPIIVPVSREERFPLSYAQQRLWFIDQAEGGSKHYLISATLNIKGELNIPALEGAFTQVMERHESLRACIRVDERNEPYQVFLSPNTFELAYEDMTTRLDDVDGFIHERVTRRFELSQDVMLRAGVVKTSTDSHKLYVVMHHIASDGWSLPILLNEVTAFYNAENRGKEAELKPLTIQYADYAYWQRNWLKGEVLDRQIEHWRKALADLPVVHGLPLDYQRPEIQTFNGDLYKYQLSNQISNQFKDLCLSANTTLFMGMQAAFSVLLSRYSNETDIVIGSPIANREQPEIATLIGFFVNMLVLRIDLSDSPDFITLLDRCKKQSLDSYEFQQVPFEQIVEELNPQRNMSHSPLFQITLTLQEENSKAASFDGLALEPIEKYSGVVKYDLELTVKPSASGMLLEWNYNTDLFKAETIHLMADRFDLLLSELVKRPQESVFNHSLLSETEIEQQLNTWNDTAKDYPLDKCIHQLFEQQVESNPDETAVIFEGHQLTYKELNTAANLLAHNLIKQGVKPDTLIGLCVKPSLEAMIGMLGILKAGGAYVPLDPYYPVERLKHMLSDSSVDLIVTQTNLVGNLPISHQHVICLDQYREFKGQTSDNPKIQTLTSKHVAYVIYTSGSTGKPKGVIQSHKALTNYVTWAGEQYFEKAHGSVVSTNLSFDASVTTLFGGLIIGKPCRLIELDDSLIPTLAHSIKTTQERCVYKVTPSHLSALMQYWLNKEPSLQEHFFVVGGEQLLQSVANAFISEVCPNSLVVNEYGPTEAMVGCSTYTLSIGMIQDSLSKAHAIPIGRPIANTELYVLDINRRAVPTGVIGELYIGGEGLAQGYLNRKELTDERFVVNSYSDDRSQKIYKTGDMVRWLDGGVLEYIGRIDEQFKVRGYRIELGEIEECLLSHADVKEAVVNPYTHAGEQTLVGYVVLNQEQGKEKKSLDTSDLYQTLKAHASEHLPNYMVPSFIVSLDSLPLTPNGKIDRKAFPQPDIGTQALAYVAPNTETETLLCEIWQEVLDVKRVGVTDNFFQLGGHSLLVIKLIARLQDAGFNLAVKQVFATNNLSELAQLIESKSGITTVFKAPENLIPEACEQITPEMLPLIELTQSDIDVIAEHVPGGMKNIQDIYPLGPLQEGIYFHHVMSKESDPYVFPNLLTVENETALNNLFEALQFIIDRHDVLRTLVLNDGLSQPTQVVCRQAKLPIEWIEVSEGSVEKHMEALCVPEKQWLDISQAPLLRVKVAKENDSSKHFVLLQYHHLATDHEGLDIIQREILAFFDGVSEQLSAPIPYREFVAHAQHHALQGDADAFFQTMLSDVSEPTLLFDLQNTQNSGAQIEEYREGVPSRIANQIRSLSQSLAISPASVFHAAWAMVLSACSHQNKVVFGTVLSGRLQGTVGSEHMMGVFINTLPIKVDVADTSALAFIQQVNTDLVSLLSYEQTPLVQVQKHSGIPSEQPLFSALMNYRHSGKNDNQADTIQGIEMSHSGARNNYPLTLSVDDYGEQGFGLVGLFDQSVNAEQLMGYMQCALVVLLEGLESESRVSVQDLSVIPASEQQQLHALAKTGESVGVEPDTAAIQQMFESQVTELSDSLAVVYDQVSLSYGELNAQANQLAHYLREQGVGRESRVALYMERSDKLIVGLLAVLKAGGAYVPLDVKWPRARINQIVSDSAVCGVLSESQWQSDLSDFDVPVHYLDKDDAWSDLPVTNPESINQAHDAAYVIYTSGTTGVPKGVVIEHRQLLNYSLGMAETLGIQGDDSNKLSFAHISTIAADLGNTSLYGALCFGGCLHLIGSECAFDPDAMSAYGQVHELDVLKIVPSHLQGLLSAQDAKSVLPRKLLILGGEACSIELIKQIKALSPQLRIINHYGPSETTVGVLTYEISDSDIESQLIPLGRPLPDSEVYVLDSAGQLSPLGVAGELYIGGAGVGRGYINRDELTAERFVSHAFDVSGQSTEQPKSTRLYRTGDKVRYLPDGNLVFMGRLDEQVKVRGYRVELGEIERCLTDIDTVQQAVVMLVDNDVNQGLIAWVVKDGVKQNSDLEQQLKHRLPDYMLPQKILSLESIPLSANGKIDRVLLKQLANEDERAPALKEFRKPKTENEIKIAKIWCEILKRDSVSIDDDFFKLGGDSILSLQVIAKAKKVGLKLTPRQLFDQPTIEKLAELAKPISKSRKRNLMVSGSVPLTPIQHWFFEAEHPDMHHWNQSVIFKATSKISFTGIQNSVEALVKHHDTLRLKFVLEGTVWQQSYSSIMSVDSAKLCRRITASELGLTEMSNEEQVSQAIELHTAKAQTALSLSEGPLIQITHFDLSDLEGQEDRILIVAHHLIIDGVSWRILLKDFAQLYHQLEQSKPIGLSDKSTSFQAWSEQLLAYAKSQKLAEEIEYWQNVMQTTSSIPFLEPKKSIEGNLVSTASTVSVELSKDQTAALIREIPVVYNTQVNDLLLAALANTLCKSEQSVIVELEGHGRESDVISEGGELDLSQTLGWFTSRFPVRLTNTSHSVDELILQTKEQLDAVPNNGIGYGVLRYLHPEANVRKAFAKHSKPKISFNYLGQFNTEKETGRLFSKTTESTGRQRAPTSKRSQLIELVSHISDDQLTINWQYSEALHDKSTIEQYANDYLKSLMNIIKHCLNEKARLQLPSAERLENSASTVIQCLRPANNDIQAQTPLFCLHHRGGHTLEYRPIADVIHPSIPVYGIQSNVLSDPDYLECDMEVVSKQYAQAIREKQPQGPYKLLGWSLGGVLAMAIAEVLESQGQKVSFIGLIDASLSNSTTLNESDSVIENLLSVVGPESFARYRAIDSIKRDALEQQIERLEENQIIDVLCDWILENQIVDEAVFDKNYLNIYYRTTLQSRRLIRSYKPQNIRAKPDVWWAEASLKDGKVPTEWQQFARALSSSSVLEGDHFDIIKHPKLHHAIARRIEEI
ncbi:non-ribosomal peptide synthetase [Alteromonadaceae bacterium M269]|nr:non-ribosomal peptide synthetase [Alteromonadaceae bacterium M269]